MKMHIFVDKQGDIVAAGPAPELSSGAAPVTKTPGPVFAGLSPGPDEEEVQAYELEVEESALDTPRDGLGDALQARLSDALRTQRGLKPVDVLR